MLWVSLSEKHMPNSALPLSRKSPSIPARNSWRSDRLMFCMPKKRWGTTGTHWRLWDFVYAG